MLVVCLFYYIVFLYCHYLLPITDYGPTVLEDEAPFQLPMDLLIDDDNTDEVLYDARSKRELNITCNPLYEQTLEDDEDTLSVQTFQSGFQTNFDNVNFIQVGQ